MSCLGYGYSDPLLLTPEIGELTLVSAGEITLSGL